MPDKDLPIINPERCDRCGKCIDACRVDALYMDEDGPAYTQPITCTYCMDCEAVCPQRAIRAPLTVAWALKA